MLQQLSLCIQNIIEAMIWGALSKLDALVNQQFKTGSQGLLLHSSRFFFYTKTRFNPDKRAKCTSVPGPHTTSTIMSGLQAMVAAQACLSLLRREIFFPPLLNLIIFPRKWHAVKTTHRSLHLLKAAFKADSFNWQQEAGSWKLQNTHISHCPESPISVSSCKAGKPESQLWKPDLKKLRQSHYYWLVTPSSVFFSCTKMQSFTWTLIWSVWLGQRTVVWKKSACILCTDSFRILQKWKKNVLGHNNYVSWSAELSYFFYRCSLIWLISWVLALVRQWHDKNSTICCALCLFHCTLGFISIRLNCWKPLMVMMGSRVFTHSLVCEKHITPHSLELLLYFPARKRHMT